jgi:hypothetical protein
MPETPSRIRETAISAMIVVVLAVGVLWALPASAIKSAVSPVLEPIGLSLGLDQNWALFAPTPPRRQEDVEVHVAMASGTEKVWTLPKRNQIFGTPYTHRWRKFKESLLTQPQIRSDFAHWVVREFTGPNDRPVRVEMLLRTEDLLPPGVSGQGQTAVQTLYSEDLTGNR